MDYYEAWLGHIFDELKAILPGESLLASRAVATAEPDLYGGARMEIQGGLLDVWFRVGTAGIIIEARFKRAGESTYTELLSQRAIPFNYADPKVMAVRVLSALKKSGYVS